MSNGQPTNRSVKEWMEDIGRGRIALPRFQRGFVWKYDTISDLILAIIKEKPVGALLAINYRKDRQAFRPLAIRGASHLFNEKDYEQHGGMMILDGQQRLTAIWCALNNTFSKEEKDKRRKREFFMEIDTDKIDSDSQDFITDIVCEKIGDIYKNQENPSKYFFEKKKIPVKLLHKDEMHKIREWVKDACGDIDSDISEKIHQRILDCNINFNQRDISFYTLPDEMEAGEMIETFVKINTSSSKMKAFDIAAAYIEDLNIKDGEGKRFRNKIEEMNIEKGRKDRFFPSGDQTSDIGELIFKIACLLTKVKDKPLVPNQGNYIREGVLVNVFEKWEIIVGAIDETLEFLERESIYDEKRLPSEVPLRVLPALFAGLPQKIDPDRKGQVDRLIRSYLWRSFVTERYDSAAESRLHQDYMRLYESVERILEGDSDTPCAAPVFNEKIYPIPNIAILSDLKNPLKSPKPKNKLPRALLILSLKKGAKDIASGEVIHFSNLKTREYHHLFPKKMLEHEGRDAGEIDHPLNFVLIQADSNKKIAAKRPKDYLFQRQVGATRERDIRARVESHLIPYDELNVETGTNRKYENFIEKRAEIFEKALRDLCEGKD